MTKADCSGCTDNFYNGNNNLGVKECWMFKTAELTKRIRIPIHQPPPYTQKPELLANCRHEKGYVLVKPEAIKSDGYWRS